MIENLSFDDAWKRLSDLVEYMEADTTPLSELSENLKEAKALLAYCEEKLREVESDINDLKDNA